VCVIVFIRVRARARTQQEACVGDQPLDDETLAAWFALGWTTYDE
jgi:hypothetical protein